jgi:Domain of unknown function (DUF4926)
VDGRDKHGHDGVEYGFGQRANALRNLLGPVMSGATLKSGEARDLLSAVALPRDLPEHGLVRGQVGTIVEALDGRAYAIVPCPRDALHGLRTAPVAESRQTKTSDQPR